MEFALPPPGVTRKPPWYRTLWWIEEEHKNREGMCPYNTSGEDRGKIDRTIVHVAETRKALTLDPGYTDWADSSSEPNSFNNLGSRSRIGFANTRSNEWNDLTSLSTCDIAGVTGEEGDRESRGDESWGDRRNRHKVGISKTDRRWGHLVRKGESIRHAGKRGKDKIWFHRSIGYTHRGEKKFYSLVMGREYDVGSWGLGKEYSRSDCMKFGSCTLPLNIRKSVARRTRLRSSGRRKLENSGSK